MALKLKPASVIVEQLGLGKNGKAQVYFTNLCYKKMDRYVPKDEGNLRKNVTIGANYIRYKSPYARYQYYGMRDDKTHVVENYTTGGTGPYWDKKMLTVERENIRKEMQERFGK